jgi:hypothetical protein
LFFCKNKAGVINHLGVKEINMTRLAVVSVDELRRPAIVGPL